MNNQRRKMLAKAAALIADAVELLEAAQEGEQQAFDNTPESLQGSEEGQAKEQMAEAISDVICSVNDAASELAEVIQKAEA